MEERDAVVKEISRDELLHKRKRGDPYILVDVLSHKHFTRVHLPGAINVPLNLLHQLAPLIFSPLDEIVVYCASFQCTASTTAAKILMQQGYPFVLDYKGGIKDWEEGKQMVMRGTPPEQAAA